MQDKLFKQFENLCNQEESNEEIFQKFLEQNTCLIPRQFVQHHGINLQTVYVKVRMTKVYISDFMLITKSSADWTCIHIEIENPKKPIFKSNGEFFAEYNSAKTQVKNWEAWFKNSENKSSFEQDIKKTMPLNMRENPINHKFVLIYGRDSEIDCEQKKGLWLEEKNSDANFYVMTWDSLFKETHNQLNLAKFTKQRIHFIYCPNLPATDTFINNGLNPADFEMSKTTIEQMKQKLLQEKKDDSNSAFSSNPLMQELYKESLQSFSKIKSFKKG